MQKGIFFQFLPLLVLRDVHSFATHGWIALFILLMSFVWPKEENNVFVHHECGCTCWRYSEKKTTTTMTQTIYSKINNKCVFTAHRALFLWYVTVIVIKEVNCQSGDILWPEIFLSFPSRPIGEMRVTLLYAKKSLPSIQLTHLISP